MPRKYKDKQHAETQKRLAHKYLWWELLCFYLFSQLKKKITFGENKHINDKLLRLRILLVSLLT